MSSNWRDYVELPESSAATPLKLRHPAAENIQSDSKKRGPTTPLTPSLIQRNILKRQLMATESRGSADQSVLMEEFKAPTNPPLISQDASSYPIKDLDNEIKDSDSFLTESGSPKSRRTSLPSSKALSAQTLNVTPRISAGIKQAVKDHKKSRLQILRTSKRDDSDMSESEYSEVSTISGDTPNYKFRENLVYYKNGYYMDNNDDSFAELERSQIINEKELTRLNNIVNFMKLERALNMEQDGENELDF